MIPTFDEWKTCFVCLDENPPERPNGCGIECLEGEQ